MTKNILLTGVGTLAMASIAVTCAAAQDTDDSRIDTITVTAQKRAENVQEVPISISAYGSEFIEDSGVENLQDIALYSPNFNISTASSATNQRITIRGVGSVSNNAIEPSVGVFIDGVYYPRSGSVVGNLIDLETIEVLRGPQGTLFGRNTPVGALNIRTKDASKNEFESSFQAGFGSQSSYNIGGSISGPLSDSVAFRISGKYSDRDGYGTNLLTGENFGEKDDLNIRGKLDFELSPQLNVILSADYGEFNYGGQTVELLNGTQPATFLPTLAALFGPDATNLLTSDPFDHDIYQEHDEVTEDEQWGMSLTGAYVLNSGHTIKSITAYREWDAFVVEQALRLPADILPRVTNYSTETFSQELQLISPGGEKFDYVAGLFFYDETYIIDQDFDFGADACIPVVFALTGSSAAAQSCAAQPQIDASDSEFDQDLQSFAVYGQGTWNFNDQWSATLGGRYTTDDKTGNYTNVVNNTFITALGLRENDSQLNLDAGDFGDTDAFTYFANLSYYPNADVMLFGTISSGFKSGGFNSEGTFPNLSRDQRGFAPEETTNYELGIKSQLLDNTLQLNATAFLMDIQDYQDRSFNGISLVVRNAGELQVQGIETDFVWAPLDQLTFLGGFSYLDSEFESYENASPLPGGAPQDLSGERSHFAPETQASLVANWEDDLTLWNGTKYFLRGEMQHVGEQNVGTSTNQNPQTIQDAYQLYNARVGLRAADDAWELSLFGRNLADEGYCINGIEQPFGSSLGGVDPTTNTSAIRCVPGAPQTWGVQFKINR